MAITEVYVDPSIAGDSGAGTVGDPYGDLQHALDTVTRDATNGDRFNIKAGTDEVLTATLDLSTYGTPTDYVRLIFQGYTSAAGDGGIGGISGAGSYTIISESAIPGIHFKDMHLHNSGSSVLTLVDFRWSFINCEFDNTTGHAIETHGSAVTIMGCYFHNCDRGIYSNYSNVTVYGCYFEQGAENFSYCIDLQQGSNFIAFNVFKLSGASIGIKIRRNASIVQNNTVYSSAGTGKGIDMQDDTWNAIVMNNYVEGFSGAGGVGIEIDDRISLLQSNRWYNNTTHLSDGGWILNNVDNTSVASSALTNPGGGDFSVGTDLKAGAWPSDFNGSNTDQFMDIGAAQREEPAGGGGGRRARIRAHGV